MSLTDFEQFRLEVLGSALLQEDLIDIESTKEFIEKAVETGRQHGFEFSANDVTEAIRAGQAEWALRWL